MNQLCLVFFMCYLNMNYVVNSAVIKSDLYRLDIVHYNDFHDRFEETSVEYPVCRSNDSSCLGGFSRLASGIKTLLKEKPDALLLNAGDAFQGTYWYSLLKWDIIQKFINMLPNDVHAIGNHEFDDGVAGLVPYLAALHAPVVAANIDTKNEPTLNGLYKPHVILERKGRRIGVIGLITTETAITSNSEEVIFLDPIETVKREAELLTADGVDIIIVLSHCGIQVDKQIAKSVGENIDIIVGGHSHSLLWNGESPSNETISGPYPVLLKTESKPEHKVLVVTASAFTKYLGNITAYFDHKGELTSFEGSPLFLNRSIPEDPEIKTLLQPYKEQLDAIVNEVIGFAESDLLADPCGLEECAIGNFMADAFLYEAEKTVESDIPTVSFLLRNNIRGSIPEGEINKGALINILPFLNKVATFKIQGRYIVEALEKCLTSSWSEKPFNSPWMPQIAGMKVSLNTTDKTVPSVLVKEKDGFKPIVPNKVYQMVTLYFLAKGGNGFSMLRDHASNMNYIGKDEKIVENYFSKITPIKPVTDNRLTILT